ncbi:hypothetical protein NDU88_003673 [Pleurodeles waltl]|uniref:Uncharacterized protein n=1 Tax=Pleurodeles waltl TaxID=8319 RepID=A0AAV7SGL3_PLEWA|nr:hypothetical protein NDU88_003673 [Pleurodeles waltl]
MLYRSVGGGGGQRGGRLWTPVEAALGTLRAPQCEALPSCGPPLIYAWPGRCAAKLQALALSDIGTLLLEMPPGLLVLGGDLKLVADPDVDRESRARPQGAPELLRAFLDMLDLVPQWWEIAILRRDNICIIQRRTAVILT